MRLDVSIEPRAYHCANLSRMELGALRTIGDVVRLGHVEMVEPDRLTLERGAVAADPDTLYIDCSASAIQVPPDVPVFDRSTVNLLLVRACQPLFSAAMIAFVEGRFSDDATKNALCRPVPVPLAALDWVRMWEASLGNMLEWGKHPEVADWLSRCRLDTLTAAQRGLDVDDPRRQFMLDALGAKAAEAAPKLADLLAGMVDA